MKKILVVDDHPEIRKLIKIALGYKFIVTEAANAEEASNRLSEDRPDLVLLDIMMPGINGLDWCLMVKKIAKLEHIKIIIVSGRSEPDDFANANLAGADAYITKPFAPSELLSKINQVLGENS